MKKFLALVLAAMMAFGFSSVALADEEASASMDAESVTITKTISQIGLLDETFAFTVTGEGVTDAAEGVTIEDYAIEADGFCITVKANETSGMYTIALPAYSSVGIYTYRISETTGSTAGVSYDAEELYLIVTVTNGTDEAGNACFLRSVAVHEGAVNGAKTTEISNTYSCGTLAVSKSVTGNLGDKTKEFTVTVTFTSENVVNSLLSYTEGDVAKEIAVSDWTETDGSYFVTVTIALKDEETITFTNIPAGVSYEVVEEDYTAEGYDEAVYTGSDEGDGAGSIETEDVDTVTIINNKASAVDTGISLDSLPYMVLLLAVGVAGMALLLRRRSLR